MTRGDPYVPLVIAAAELKRKAPIEFELFLKSVQASASAARSSLVVADAKGIFQAQGKAQALDTLAKKLEDCLSLDEQYRARR